MREDVYPEDLEIGQAYIERNPYHHEYEYGTVYYAGETYNKYGEIVYLFSERELPDDYDGIPDNHVNIGGPLYTYDDIVNGCICEIGD